MTMAVANRKGVALTGALVAGIGPRWLPSRRNGGMDGVSRD